MMAENGKVEAPAFLYDGYTVRGYIAPIDRLYPAVRFTYRPMLSQNRAVVYREMDTIKDARKVESVAAAAVAAQVSEWDIRDQNGCQIAISPSNVLRLQPRLSNRIFRVIMGDEAPDEDPGLPNKERDEAASAALALALSGATPEEADAKNSPTG